MKETSREQARALKAMHRDTCGAEQAEWTGLNPDGNYYWSLDRPMAAFMLYWLEGELLLLKESRKSATLEEASRIKEVELHYMDLMDACRWYLLGRA